MSKKIRIVSEEGLTKIWIDDKELDMVKSVHFSQEGGDPLPIVTICLYADVDIECQEISTRVYKKNRQATQT